MLSSKTMKVTLSVFHFDFVSIKFSTLLKEKETKDRMGDCNDNNPKPYKHTDTKKEAGISCQDNPQEKNGQDITFQWFWWIPDECVSSIGYTAAKTSRPMFFPFLAERRRWEK